MPHTDRQAYLTQDNIAEKGQAFLDEFSVRRAELCVEHSALLIMDMQRFFVDAASHAWVPSAAAIVPEITALAAAYNRAGLPVVLTQHINTAANSRLMATWWRDVITAEHPLSGIIDELAGCGGNVITKTQYDAFFQTNLDQLLRSKNVTHLVLTGVMTHLCVETTARSAFTRGLQPFVVVDATATYNEEFHRASLRNLCHGFAVPLRGRDLCEAMP